MKNRFLASASALAFASGAASGAGYYLPNQDAFATARGNAFVATADSAAAVFYNPAGLTQLKEAQAQAGVYSIVLGNQAKVMGKTVHAEDELQAVPHIYYAQPLNDRLSFGFALNSPFGLGTDWGRYNNFSPVVTETRLMYISATSAIAYKVTDELSVGGSFSVNYAQLKLEQGLRSAPTTSIPGSYLRFTGDDVGVAGSLAVLWQPCERHSFGLNYTSKSTFDLNGKTESNILGNDHSAGLDFMAPARAAAGYSYRPAPGWNLEANLEWIDWDSLNSLTLKSDNIGGPTEMAVPFDWKSSLIYEIGGSYTNSRGYTFSAGYDFNASSQPDAHYTPGVADADLSWLNLGVSRNYGNYGWSLTYQFGYANRTVDGAIDPLANGKYESRHNSLVLGWQQKF